MDYLISESPLLDDCAITAVFTVKIEHFYLQYRVTMWSRDAILALRLAGASLNVHAQRSLEIAGCLRRLRGCRVGRRVQLRRGRAFAALLGSETETTGNIPVIIWSVARQLTTHLESNGLIPALQSAYRRNHSTETALLKICNDALMAADNGMVTLVVLLDYSAAFDTVDHSIMLDLLERRCWLTECITVAYELPP